MDLASLVIAVLLAMIAGLVLLIVDWRGERRSLRADVTALRVVAARQGEKITNLERTLAALPVAGQGSHYPIGLSVPARAPARGALDDDGEPVSRPRGVIAEIAEAMTPDMWAAVDRAAATEGLSRLEALDALVRRGLPRVEDDVREAEARGERIALKDEPISLTPPPVAVGAGHCGGPLCLDGAAACACPCAGCADPRAPSAA